MIETEKLPVKNTNKHKAKGISHTAGEMQIKTTILGKFGTTFIKLKIHITYCPVILLLHTPNRDAHIWGSRDMSYYAQIII